MVRWIKVGTDVAVGGAVGVVDQLVQKKDEERMAEKPDMGMISQYSTYYNYGVPILAILGVAFNMLKGDWATRAVVAGSQLAGRKVTKKITEKGSVPYTNWSRQNQLEAARQRALVGARGARTQLNTGIPGQTIPVVAGETMLV